MTTPSIVAGKLTEAQKESLRAMPPNHTFKPRTYVRNPATWACLKSLRLIRSVNDEGYGVDAYSLLTGLGIEVRALLHKEEGCGG